MGWQSPPPDPTVQSLDDDHLIALVRENPALFEVVYDRYFQRVYRYCLKRTSNVQIAEDLSSEIFITTLEKLDHYRGGNFAAWLFRIAHNTVVDHYRRERESVALDAIQLHDHAQLAQMVGDQLLVEDMLADLNEAERELLALRMGANLSAPEIGELLGKSANNVRVQLYRLLKRLRDRYENRMGDDA